MNITDVETSISLKDNAFKNCFKRLSPENLTISKNDGRFNRSLSLGKDYQMGLASFLGE